MVGTPAHPLPRGSRSTPRKSKVKSVWEALPGQITDASSKFGGAKKGLKVTSTNGDVLEVPAAELGPSCDDDFMEDLGVRRGSSVAFCPTNSAMLACWWS